jgi:hypothetical protein
VTVPNTTFRLPTSLLVYGDRESLLAWVSLAVVSAAPGGYYWTEVRPTDETVDPEGPLARGAVPADLWRVRHPDEYAVNDTASNAAISAVVRSDDAAASLGPLVNFLRLPSPTQAFIASHSEGAAPLVFVVSNARAMGTSVPLGAARPLMETILSHGYCVLVIFQGAPPDWTRQAFDNVWRIDAPGGVSWKTARLTVERADSRGPLPIGTQASLGDLPLVNFFLMRYLDAT